MASEKLYSSFVAMVKIILPLSALAILSSVVYFASGTDNERRYPFVTVEGEQFERERVASPEYQSVTTDGSAVRIVANEVVPVGGRTEVYDADSIKGRIVTEAGRQIQATAPKGRLDVAGELANMSGIVSVDTSDGYHVLTDALQARLDITFIESGGPIWGETPMGHIEAGRMRYGDPGKTSDLLHFTGGVKVIYQPRD